MTDQNVWVDIAQVAKRDYDGRRHVKGCWSVKPATWKDGVRLATPEEMHTIQSCQHCTNVAPVTGVDLTTLCTGCFLIPCDCI
jgi:hypothetical protein